LEQQPENCSENDSNNNDNNKLRKPQPVIDASLVGKFLVQMSSSSSTNKTFTWSLHSIKDVIAASSTVLGSKHEDVIWTDGTEASEALKYGLCSSPVDVISGLKPRMEIKCLTDPTESDWLESEVCYNNDTNNYNEEDEDLLRLLRILQAQWVAGQKTRLDEELWGRNKEPLVQIEDDRKNLWRLSVGNLLSQDGISQLLRKAGVLNGDTSSIEWIEMMTGSSRIVGRLPRSLVHKFNILHRGIGAFVTRDRPIDFSSIPSLSSTTFPDLYVHRRTADKRIFPSLYDMWVGGVSLAGEDSEVTAQREIAEELGLPRALSTSLTTFSDGKPFLTCLVCTAYNRCIVDLFQYAMDTSSEQIEWQKEEVAWGDFVDYRVIMASADLSIQRSASARSWPGSYPPIQSELQGALPEGDDSEIAKYDENWKEWDYVPDGLLVWKAWLEFFKQEQSGRYQSQEQQQILSFEIEFGVEEGKSEIVTIELASMEDIVPKSQELAARFNTDVDEIQTLLKKLWTDVTFVPIYNGPSFLIKNADNHAECNIELPSGLIVELRPSTIGENTGLGVFIRKASSDIDDVLQTQGSAFCGYGPCDQITDSLSGLTEYQCQRSFEFLLSDGLESYVWYKGNLLTVRDALRSTGATGVKAHCLIEKTEEERDDSSRSLSPVLKLIHDPEKPCYLVPPAERPDPKSLTIQTIGHMCNDLAGGIQGQIEEVYDTTSNRDNLLVLVPRIEMNDNGILQPNGMPILTLCKSVSVANDAESMEVGLRYGHSYWKNGLSRGR